MTKNCLGTKQVTVRVLQTLNSIAVIKYTAVERHSNFSAVGNFNRISIILKFMLPQCAVAVN